MSTGSSGGAKPMSKLAQRFAMGKAALEVRTTEAEKTGAIIPTVERPAGPLHGAVTNMKLDMLTNEVRELRAGKPMVRLPAQQIRPSSWKNRHDDSYKSEEFELLRAEIRHAGGNIQPIKVRPIEASAGSPFKYEIVFGRRRHRACLEEGLDVLAIIEEMDDHRLFIEMDRENRQREDLRPYEQGMMYVDALDRGLFSSLRKLAEDVGADPTNVSRAVALARFPEKVIAAFESPLDIQYRWVSDIKAALESDADTVLSRAAALVKSRSEGKSVPSAQAYSLLVGKEVKPPKGRPRVVKVGACVLSIAERGGKVSYELDGLGRDKLKKVEEFIAGLMAMPD